MHGVMDRPTIAEIDKLCLQISPAVQDKAWEEAQKQSNPIARYQAYMNYVCLHTFLEWLKEWLEETGVDKPTVWHEHDLANIWEFVNGSAILLGETRLVLIPADATEMEDLSVPREWVDNPNWKADYYLAVAVNLDGDESECWIELCGFATHRQLYHEGCYNEGDRTYRLEMKDLTTDLMVMDLTLGLHLQRKVKDLPRLLKSEAEKMLRQLSESLVSSPKLRLTVDSFEKWLALLDNDELRRELYHLRSSDGTVATEPLGTEIAYWKERLEKVFDETWQTVTEVIDTIGTPEPSLAFASRGVFRFRDSNPQADITISELISLLSTSNDKLTRWEAIELLGHKAKGNQDAIACLQDVLNNYEDRDLVQEAAVSLGEIDPANPRAGVKRAKTIDLGIQLKEYKVALVATLMPQADAEEIKINFQVHPADGKKYLPPNLKLIVLNEDGEKFDESRSRRYDQAIQLELAGESGVRFTVKLALGDAYITEEFVLGF